ncbi:hypothetical protein OSTOST_26142, partial [Ostertagia ostertagi]
MGCYHPGRVVRDGTRSHSAGAFVRSTVLNLPLLRTTDFSNQYSLYRGFSRNPVITPNYYTKGYHMMTYDVLNFFPRLYSIRDAIFEQYYIGVASNRWLRKAGELLNVQNSYETIFEASRVSLTDFPARYGYVCSTGTDLIHVGEYCQGSNELPLDLRSFVEDSKSKRNDIHCVWLNCQLECGQSRGGSCTYSDLLECAL